jgi:hypothetical protein
MCAAYAIFACMCDSVYAYFRGPESAPAHALQLITTYANDENTHD